MSAPATYRGQPLVALCMILGGWVAMRAMVWDAAAVASDAGLRPAQFAMSQPLADLRRGAGPSLEAASDIRPGRAAQAPRAGSAPPAWSFAAPPPSAPVAAARAPGLATQPSAVRPPLPIPAPRVPVRTAVGHNLMWMAAMSRLPLPDAFTATPVATPPPLLAAAPALRAGSRRWSADGWMLLRRGGGTAPGAAPLASYGASQVGAVVRYRLAPASPHRPAAYLRATAALATRDQTAALGLSARPLAGLPVVVAGEARIARQPGGTRVRPAVFAYTELPAAALPLAMRGEGYAQAGYVGGHGGTAFVDGQLRIDRRVARMGPAELRAGAGAWGGAQNGASRIDIGPTATLGLTGTGSAAARLGVDWRFRVAGAAAPSSGPALTLSAGF